MSKISFVLILCFIQRHRYQMANYILRILKGKVVKLTFTIKISLLIRYVKITYVIILVEWLSRIALLYLVFFQSFVFGYRQNSFIRQGFKVFPLKSLNLQMIIYDNRTQILNYRAHICRKLLRYICLLMTTCKFRFIKLFYEPIIVDHENAASRQLQRT